MTAANPTPTPLVPQPVPQPVPRPVPGPGRPGRSLGAKFPRPDFPETRDKNDVCRDT